MLQKRFQASDNLSSSKKIYEFAERNLGEMLLKLMHSFNLIFIGIKWKIFRA